MIITQAPLQIDLSDPITLALVFFALAAVIILEVFFGRGIFLIKENQVGVLTKKFGGQRMPEGQIIARKGQVGVQARTLMPGLYWRLPLIWKVEKYGITEIATDKIGTVEAIDGEPLLSGRFTGDEVDCNKFQNAEAFLENHGKKGQQVGVLTPGNYRINPRLFVVQVKDAVVIDPDSTGIITAQDGIPLPSDLIVAPQPEEMPKNFPKARPHRHFQDGQAFIDSGGYRGPQLDTLQPGKYFINDLLFTVMKVPKYEVEPGFVAVLRSNVGKELQQSQRTPLPVETETRFTITEPQVTASSLQGADPNEKISSDIESVLISDKLSRGIFDQPLAPGTYNLNTIAYTAYAVPTSAIMIDWADSSKVSAPTMEGAAATTKTMTTGAVTNADKATYPYTEDVSTKGISYFNFSQLEVISADGFQLEVGVRMVIRIRQENAAFVIARFGTVFNLIQQIVHPLIDSSFRNDAGSKKALEFFQSRTQLQQYVFDNARKVFGLYHVEAQGLLISFIRPADQQGVNLLSTQTLKEIAIQQQTQLEQQANAEAKRIVVQEQTARANMQPQVVGALLKIDIERNNAEAVRRQSEGLRDYRINLAQGEATAIRQVGEAQADAYHAQAQVLGAERVGLVKVMEEIKDTSTQLVPQTLVMSGTGGDGSSPIITAWFAKALGAPAPTLTPYENKTQSQPQNNQNSPGNRKDQTGTGTASAMSSLMDQQVPNTIPGSLEVNKVTPVSLQQESPATQYSSQQTPTDMQQTSMQTAGVSDTKTKKGKA